MLCSASKLFVFFNISIFQQLKKNCTHIVFIVFETHKLNSINNGFLQ